MNPTIITWNSDEQFSYDGFPSSNNANTGYQVDVFNGTYRYQLSGDFNGDGYSDLFRIVTGVDHAWFDIFLSDGGLHFNQLTSFNTVDYGISQQITDVAVFDRDGDGVDEIALIDNSYNKIHFLSLKHPSSGTYTISNNPVDLPMAGRMLNMRPGDFDGNGITDVMLVYSGVDTGSNRFSFYGFYMNGGNTPVGVPGFSFNPNSPSQVTVMDFNGNGKTDILCVGLNSYSIYELNGSSMTTLVDNVAGLYAYDKIYVGDYNGDGKSDLFLSSVYQPPVLNLVSRQFTMMLSTGKDFDTKMLPEINGNTSIRFNNVGSDKYVDYGKASIYTGDFNADGRSDLVFVSKANDDNNNYTHNFSYYYGMGNTLSLDRNTTYNIDSREMILHGDFDGNGARDMLASYNSTSGTMEVRGKNSGTRKVIKEVINGLGNKITFTYGALTMGTNDYANFYIPDNTMPTYPVVKYRGALWAVSSITKPNGTGLPFGGTNTIQYFYRGGSAHLAGKGFLGFNKVISYNQASGFWNVNYYGLNNQYYVPYLSKTESYFYLTDTPVFENVPTTAIRSKTEYTQNIVPAFISNLKFFFQSTDVVVSTDYLTNRRLTKFLTFDSGTGELSNEQTNYGNTALYNAAGYTNIAYTYNTYGTTNIRRLSTAKTTKFVTGSDAVYTRKVTYGQYDNYARPTKIVYDDDQLSDFGHTTQYTYDSFGNITNTSETGAGKTTTKAYTYSGNGRFLLSEQANNEPAAQYTYDDFTGLMLKHTAPNGLSVTYDQYDAAGRLLQSTDATGVVLKHTYAWNIDGARLLSKITTEATGMPTVTAFYDVLGREVITQSQAFGGKTMEASVSYDKLGREQYKYMPHYTDETNIDNQYKVTNLYMGDGSNRLQNVQAIGLTTSYEYSNIYQNSRYFYKTKVNLPDGTSFKSSTVNEWDLLVSSVGEDGNTINYSKYHSSGQVATTDVNGTSVQNVFDVLAQQTSLSDPSVGTNNYTYDAYGHLNNEVTTKGSTSIIYDDLWRPSVHHLTSTDGTEDITINTTYYPSGNAAYGKPKQVSFGSGSAQQVQYEYDSKGRILKTKQDITPAGLAKTFTLQNSVVYDATTGKVSRKVFPSGLSLDYIYDAVGNLVQVNRTGSNTPVWQLTAVKASGKPLQIQYGNGAVADYTYDATGSYTTEHKLTLPAANGTYYYRTGFALADGNLTYRTNFEQVANLRYEYFQYDNADRLTVISPLYTAVTTSPDFTTVNAKKISYLASGDIDTKFDAGKYSYNKTGDPYAVTEVDPTVYTSAIPQQQQDVVYNMFERVVSITENNNSATFTYGPDLERIAMKDGNKYILYGDDYEAELDANGNILREWTYITGPDGIAAVWINNGGTSAMYYAHADHLGSVLLLTKEDGSVAEKNNFDAWGRRRNPASASLDYYTTAPPAGLLRRGYTFHEHLDNYGLINMNARLYDPVLGRFLGPDGYIQAPGLAQSYNRYSYCLNNPLKYTDPSGNFIPVIIGEIMVVMANAAICSGAMYVAGYGMSHNFDYSHFDWSQYAATVGWGAVSGALTFGVGSLFGGLGGGGALLSKVGMGPGSGSWSWVAWEAERALTHGMVQGTLSVMQGGDFGSGFVSGSLSSFASSMMGTLGIVKNWSNNSRNISMVAVSGLTGGVSSAVQGGSFWEGASTGIIISALNHLGHLTEQSTEDGNKGFDWDAWFNSLKGNSSTNTGWEEFYSYDENGNRNGLGKGPNLLFNTLATGTSLVGGAYAFTALRTAITLGTRLLAGADLTVNALGVISGINGMRYSINPKGRFVYDNSTFDKSVAWVGIGNAAFGLRPVISGPTFFNIATIGINSFQLYHAP